jgi:hypothetical protein
VVLPNGNASLSWPAVPGRSYQVQYKLNLSDPEWQNAPGNPWVIGSRGYFVMPGAAPGWFYRVVEVN